MPCHVLLAVPRVPLALISSMMLRKLLPNLGERGGCAPKLHQHGRNEAPPYLVRFVFNARPRRPFFLLGAGNVGGHRPSFARNDLPALLLVVLGRVDSAHIAALSRRGVLLTHDFQIRVASSAVVLRPAIARGSRPAVR